MTTYRTLVNEKAYEVSVDQTGKDRFTVKLNNEAFECEMVRNDEISAWVIKADDYEIVAHLMPPLKEKMDVWIAGVPFSTSVALQGPAPHSTSVETSNKIVGGQIRALMPGRITSVLVKDEDTVSVGSPLLILEAMKMQNEIVSPISGKVKSIRVQEGTAVKRDTILIVIG